jgi:hypothetical protein
MAPYKRAPSEPSRQMKVDCDDDTVLDGLRRGDELDGVIDPFRAHRVRAGRTPQYGRSPAIAASSQLRAVAFDLDRLEVRSDPVPVVQGLVTKGTGTADVAVAQNGSLIYVTGDTDAGARRRLVWVDRRGQEEVIAAPLRLYSTVRIAPDGTKVAQPFATRTLTSGCGISRAPRSRGSRSTH